MTLFISLAKNLLSAVREFDDETFDDFQEAAELMNRYIAANRSRKSEIRHVVGLFGSVFLRARYSTRYKVHIITEIMDLGDHTPPPARDADSRSLKDNDLVVLSRKIPSNRRPGGRTWNVDELLPGRRRLSGNRTIHRNDIVYLDR